MCIFLFFPSPERIEKNASLLIMKGQFDELEKLSNKIAKYIAKKQHKLSSDKLKKYQELLDDIKEFL